MRFNMKNIAYGADISKVLVFVLAFMLVTAVPALAGAGDVTGVVFTWKNMGLMGPGYESEHYVSVTRASDVIQHSIDYHEGEMVQKIILYRADYAARIRLLDTLENTVKSWASNYREKIVDGSYWRVVIHYADGAMKEFDGYGKTPPNAGEIKEQVLKLAKFEINPKLF